MALKMKNQLAGDGENAKVLPYLLTDRAFQADLVQMSFLTVVDSLTLLSAVSNDTRLKMLTH